MLEDLFAYHFRKIRNNTNAHTGLDKEWKTRNYLSKYYPLKLALS